MQSFKWSPDSKRVAYRLHDTDEGRFELYSVLANGTGNIRLNGDLVGGGTVRPEYEWAPDGHRIAYRAAQDTLGRNELYTSLPDGKDNQKVSELTTFGNVEAFAWSPDSSAIAYTARQLDDTKLELFLSRPESSTGNTRLNSDLAGEFVINFHWSPDSRYLAYQAYEDSDAVLELYLVDLNDQANPAVQKAHPDYPDASAGAFTALWSPDSQYLAIIADVSTPGLYELFRVRPVGTDLQKVNDVPPNSFIPSLRWSPDSQRMAYMADKTTASQFELFSAAIDGSPPVKVSGELVEGGFDNLIQLVDSNTPSTRGQDRRRYNSYRQRPQNALQWRYILIRSLYDHNQPEPPVRSTQSG